ncbi:hypothetical protein AB0K68_32940 [Streptomyces sp. NPDC050698]
MAVAPASVRTPAWAADTAWSSSGASRRPSTPQCEKYSHRSPVFIEVPGIKVPPTESGSRVSGPIPLERIPAALDAAGVGTLLLPVLWSTDEVRARVKAAIAAQWGPGKNWKAAEGVAEPAVGGRIEVVFLHDKAGALGHGTAH